MVILKKKKRRIFELPKKTLKKEKTCRTGGLGEKIQGGVLQTQRKSLQKTQKKRNGFKRG